MRDDKERQPIEHQKKGQTLLLDSSTRAESVAVSVALSSNLVEAAKSAGQQEVQTMTVHSVYQSLT